MAIKAKIGSLKLPDLPEKFIPEQMITNNISGLPIHPVHALHVYSLPDHHRDPFDRMLIAQAQIERAPIITNDRLFADYDVKILWDKKKKR
jgi:PIN domain nuclease of toxin-antitoxin system